MKRKLISLWMIAMLCLPASAQRIVEANDEFADYNRNSVSVVFTKYNDRFDSNVEAALSGFGMSKKFDVNNINTKNVTLSVNRFVEINNSIKGYQPDGMTARNIKNCLNEAKVGKQIFDYVLQRDAEGRFSRQILDERGLWNATDKDALEAQMTQVDALGQNGEALIEKSYVVVIDAKNPTRKERQVKDSKGNTVTKQYWTVNMGGYVYKISNGHEIAVRVLNDMWIYDKDDAATQAAKKKAYDDLEIEMTLEEAVGVTSIDEDLQKAIESGARSLVGKMVKEISAWQVAIDCETVKPFITAKIGTKEGVRNGHRYAIFGQVYNPKKEVNEFRRKGFVRATVVADNMKVADGHADSTYFYRISGVKPLKGNEILKEKKDVGLSVSLDYTLNGSSGAPKETRTFGSFSMVNLGLDYLINIGKRGFSQYFTMNFGLDYMSGDHILQGHNEFGEYSMIYNEDGEFLFKNGAVFFNTSLGYMCGIKIYHFLEIQPYLRIGADVYGGSKVSLEKLKELANIENYTPVEEMTEDNTKTKAYLYLDPGVRFAFNVYYPVQVYTQVNYNVNIWGFDAYKVINDYLKDCGYGHSHGLGLAFGVRCCF